MEVTTTLKIELERTNALFQRWSTDSSSWLSKATSDHERAIEEVECTLQALRATAQQLEESRALNDAIKIQQKKEVDAAIIHNEGLKRQLVALESQLMSYRDEEQSSQQKLEKVRTEHDNLRQKVERNLHDLTHGIAHFSKLGLEFQKADGDSMRFVFTNIDRANPQRQFQFTMFVDSDNQYRLVDTSPKLQDSTVGGLITKLNADNDISAFVYSIRCLFVRMV